MFLLFDDSFIAELGNNRGEIREYMKIVKELCWVYNKVTTVITLILL